MLLQFARLYTSAVVAWAVWAALPLWRRCGDLHGAQLLAEASLGQYAEARYNEVQHLVVLVWRDNLAVQPIHWRDSSNNLKVFDSRRYSGELSK